jgi:hypothetical protein
MESVRAIPIGSRPRRAGVRDAKSRKQLLEVIGTVRMHLNGLGDHAVQIDSTPRLDRPGVS